MQQNNLTLEERTVTPEIREWVIENLTQDKLYSELTDLERRIEHKKQELDVGLSFCSDSVKKMIYDNISEALTDFNSNKRDKLSDKEGSIDYIGKSIASKELIDERKLKQEFKVGATSGSRTRCESVSTLIDRVKQYNQFISNLKVKKEIEEEFNTFSAIYDVKSELVNPNHNPLQYHKHLFDQTLDDYHAGKLTDEQVLFAKDYLELKGREYGSQPIISIAGEDDIDEVVAPEGIERLSVPSRSREGKEHYIPVFPADENGEIRIGECSCEDTKYNKNPDCYHRVQKKHELGIPQAVQLDLNI
jgi:hypothetical protein